MVTLSQPAGQEHKIITLKPNGTQLAGFADDYITTGFLLNTKGSIGEVKQAQIEIELDYYTGQTWENKDIFIDPALFVLNFQTHPSSGQPTPGWKFSIPVGLPSGTYPMIWYGCVGTDNQNKNYACSLVYDTETTNIIIKHTFYTTYDIEDFISCAAQDNNKRLLRSKMSDPNDLDVDMTSSVYGTILKHYAYYIYVRDVSDNTNDKLYNYANVAFGMLNKSYQNGTAHFPDQLFEFSVAGINSGNNLSHQLDTKVRFQIHDQFIRTPTNAFAWLIRVDNGLFGNINWLTKYDYSFAEILTNAGTSTLHNAIKAPSTNLTALGGNLWDISFHINPLEIVEGAKYRVITVIYANPADVAPFNNQYVNSYCSEELTAFFIPEFDPDACNPFTVDKQIIDYRNDLATDCLVTVPEDRLKIGGVLNYADNPYADLDTCLFERLGLHLAGLDPRYYLKKITCEIYEEYVSGTDTIKNVFDRKEINRTSPLVYSIPTGMEFYSLDWTLSFFFYYSFRIRYENGIANMESYINDVIQAVPLTNQNWSNRNLIVRWDFMFEYHDYGTPFQEVFSTHYKLCVDEYENEKSDPVLLCEGDAPENCGFASDAVVICDGSNCLPGDTSPNVSALQALGQLPTTIPIGLKLLYINDWPGGFAGIFKWNGSSFILTHTIVKDDIVCNKGRYIEGVLQVYIVYYEFLQLSYRIDDGCPCVEQIVESCDQYYLCKGDTLCINVLLDKPDCEEYMAIGTIDRPSYGIINIQEEELLEDGELPQTFANHIAMSNEFFGDDPYKPCIAEVCIDSTNLNVGTTYKVSVMAKGIASLCSVWESFIVFDLVTTDFDLKKFDMTVQIAQTASAEAYVYYLDNPSKVFTVQTTLDSSNFVINNDEHLWVDGDGEVNVLVKWFDPLCPEDIKEHICRLEWDGGQWLLIETIELTPGTEPEVTAYEARLTFFGASADAIEYEGLNYWRKYIDQQRAKTLRFNPFFGVDLSSAMHPFIFNQDESATPLGGFQDTNNGFVGGDYTQNGTNQGIQGDGASYIDINFDTGAIAEFGQDDCSMGLFFKIINSVNAIDMGVLGTNFCVIVPYLGGSWGMSLNQAGYGTFQASVNEPGVYLCSREINTTVHQMINNVNIDDAQASTGKENLESRVFTCNGVGIFSTNLISGYFKGTGMTVFEMQRFTSAWKFLLIYTGKR